jgi:hypothetical protein
MLCCVSWRNDFIERLNLLELPFSKTEFLAIDKKILAAGAKIFYLFITTTIIFYMLSDWAYDDPFITYRYARNLRDGLGMVYNPGQRVLSTTTPLFTLLLAFLGNLWGDFSHLANLVGALSLALGGVFLWDLAKTWGSPVVSWVALLLYPAFPLLTSTLGSETPLYLMFCLAAFAFYARQRYLITAVFAGLAVLTRPDGALVAFILAGDYLFRQRKSIPWLPVALFIGINLAWFSFAWIYFGHPLPATLVAKQNQGSLAISQRFAPGILTILKPYATQWYYWLQAGLALLGIIYAIRRKQLWAIILSWTAVYFLAYSILGVSRYFWYYAPLVPGFVVLVGLGIQSIFDSSKIIRQRSAPGASFVTGLVGLLILALVVSQGSSLVEQRQAKDDRYFVYRAIGEWLDQNAAPLATVGALEVGIIGYYARRPMIDFAGLIQPDVATQLQGSATYEDSAAWAVDRYRPDYLVLPEGGFDQLLKGYVLIHCVLARQFSGEQYGSSRNLDVYDCQ